MKQRMKKAALFENDLSEPGILSPMEFISHRCALKRVPLPRLPGLCILGFLPQFQRYIQKMYKPVIVDFLNPGHPYAHFTKNTKSMTYLFPGIGASLSGALLEECIALGAETILFIGTAGVLDPAIGREEIILPSCALRDEGTSFHYAPAGRYAEPDSLLLAAVRNTLIKRALFYHEGMTWTTDAPYRETPSSVKRMRKEGCICVDMEASALFSIACYRKVRIAGLFLSRDGVFENGWKPELPARPLHRIRPVCLFEIAADVLSEFSGKR